MVLGQERPVWVSGEVTARDTVPQTAIRAAFVRAAGRAPLFVAPEIVEIVRAILKQS